MFLSEERHIVHKSFITRFFSFSMSSIILKMYTCSIFMIVVELSTQVLI